MCLCVFKSKGFKLHTSTLCVSTINPLFWQLIISYHRIIVGKVKIGCLCQYARRNKNIFECCNIKIFVRRRYLDQVAFHGQAYRPGWKNLNRPVNICKFHINKYPAAICYIRAQIRHIHQSAGRAACTLNFSTSLCRIARSEANPATCKDDSICESSSRCRLGPGN